MSARSVRLGHAAHWEELTLLDHGTTKIVSKNRTTRQNGLRKGGERDRFAWARERKTDECCQVRRRNDAERELVRCWWRRSQGAGAARPHPTERPALWKTMAAIWPAYDEYQARTAREIPVVIIERA